MDLRQLRRNQKIKIKDIPLQPKTVRMIEQENDNVTVKSLKTYCQAIGVKVIYSI